METKDEKRQIDDCSSSPENVKIGTSRVIAIGVMICLLFFGIFLPVAGIGVTETMLICPILMLIIVFIFSLSNSAGT
jgi:hypothetical membrane protein